jgi:hypothetical protein
MRDGLQGWLAGLLRVRVEKGTGQKGRERKAQIRIG